MLAKLTGRRALKGAGAPTHEIGIPTGPTLPATDAVTWDQVRAAQAVSVDGMAELLCDSIYGDETLGSAYTGRDLVMAAQEVEHLRSMSADALVEVANLRHNPVAMVRALLILRVRRGL